MGTRSMEEERIEAAARALDALESAITAERQGEPFDGLDGVRQDAVDTALEALRSALTSQEAAEAARPAGPEAPAGGGAEAGAFIDIVFDGPPGHESGRFVEVENEAGASIRVGDWIDRGNGLWALRIPNPTPAPLGAPERAVAEDGKAIRLLASAVVQGCGDMDGRTVSHDFISAWEDAFAYFGLKEPADTIAALNAAADAKVAALSPVAPAAPDAAQVDARHLPLGMRATLREAGYSRQEIDEAFYAEPDAALLERVAREAIRLLLAGHRGDEGGAINVGDAVARAIAAAQSKEVDRA